MLSLALATTLALALTAQQGDAEPAPPDPAVEEAPAAEAAETETPSDDAAEAAPEETAEDASATPSPPAEPPAAGEPPPVVEPTPAPKPEKKPAPAVPAPAAAGKPAPPPGKTAPAPSATAEPAGMGPFMTRVAQFGVGCGLGVLGNACCFIPYVGVPLSLCVSPIVTGSVVALTGEAIGQQRGSVGLPILTSYGVQLLTLVGSLGVFVGSAAALGFVGSTTMVQDLLSSSDPSAALLGLLGALVVPWAAAAGVLVVGAIMQGVATGCVYGMTTDDKQPGDEGFRMPGFFSPNHPEEPAATKVQRVQDGPRVAAAMAY